MFRHTTCCRPSCLAFLLAAVLPGCGGGGPTLHQVTGKVTLPGGASPAGWTVVFVDEGSGSAGSGTVQPNGTYSARFGGTDGLPAGTFRVSLSPPSQEMSDAEYATYMDASDAEKKKIDAARDEAAKLVPEKYRDAETSGLTCEVGDAPITFDIVVE